MIEASTSQNIARNTTIHVQVRAPEQELKPMSADGGARKDSRKDSNSAGGAQPHAAMQKPLYVLAPSPDPTPTGVYLPRSSEWGEPEEGAGAGVYSPGYGFPRVSPRLPPPLGVGDAGILNAETGEGAFCPLPVCPTPRAYTSHGPANGESLKREAGWGMLAY